MYLTGLKSNMLVCWGDLNQVYFTVKLILCKDQKCKNKVHIE